MPCENCTYIVWRPRPGSFLTPSIVEPAKPPAPAGPSRIFILIFSQAIYIMFAGKKKRSGLRTAEKKILRYELTHKKIVMLTLVGVCGFIIFWKGFSILLERYFSQTEPLAFMAIGFVLMFLTGWFIKK